MNTVNINGLLPRRSEPARVIPSSAVIAKREASRMATEVANMSDSARANAFDNTWKMGSVLEEIESIISGWLIRCHVPVMYAPPRSGKSWVAIMMALCVATGSDFQGIPVEEGFAVYLAAENSDEVKKNILTMVEAVGFDPEKVASNLMVIHSGIAITESKMDELIEGFTRMRRMPDLIIYDTLADAAGGQSLGHATVITRIYNALSRLARVTQASVLVLHHTKPDGQGMSGSQRLADAFGDKISVTSAEGTIRAEVVRLKGGEAAAPGYFSDMQTADGRPCVIEMVGDSSPMESAAMEIMTYLSGQTSGSRAAVVARKLGMPAPEVQGVLDILVASHLAVRDVLTGAYSAA